MAGPPSGSGPSVLAAGSGRPLTERVDDWPAAAPTRPAELDIGLAARAVAVHCAVAWPDGLRCLNCGFAHPCPTRSWGLRVLEAAGWSQAKIAALDHRSGPWS